MFFSIVIPVYNVEKYLNECVDSVLCQSFSDYELILVDDGSTDKSGEICDEYAKNHPEKVCALHKPNGGLSDARNVGTAAAKGKYITYIDSDDYLTSPDFLKDLYENLSQTEADIVLYKFSKFYDETKKLDECTFDLPVSNGENSDEYLLNLVKNDAYYGMAWIKAFKSSIVKENGVTFEKGLLGEDMDWYFSLILNVKTVSSINKSYIAYRQRAGSITKSLKLKNLTDFIYILEKWSKIIENAEISETKKLALNGALAKYYSNLLVTYARLTDGEKKKYKKRIKDLSYLLNFSLSDRPKKIRKFYKLLGLSGTAFLLKVYDKAR